MSAKDVKGQALWRHRGAVIAPLILISLVGLGLVGSAQGGEAPASVLGAQIRVRPTSGPMGTGIRWTYSTTIAVRPRFGPGGTTIMVRGSGFSALYCSIYISFTDAVGTVTTLDTLGPMSSFVVYEVIPPDAAIGAGRVTASQNGYNPGIHRCSYIGVFPGTAPFTVTGLSMN